MEILEFKSCMFYESSNSIFVQVMETERYIYLVMEYAPNGEIFGKLISIILNCNKLRMRYLLIFLFVFFNFKLQMKSLINDNM